MDAENLHELARIFRCGRQGVDGYQWGDTPGADGNYGKETLERLVTAGYAERTGRDVKNQLGGTWPEVKVTPTGARALIESGVLLKMQEVFPRAVAFGRGNCGNFTFDVTSGAVLGPLYVPDETYSPGDGDPSRDELIAVAPIRIDVDELLERYPDEELEGHSYDVLDLGFQNVSGNHADPDEEWRDQFRPGTRLSCRM
jgi:hypothetical protein